MIDQENQTVFAQEEPLMERSFTPEEETTEAVVDPKKKQRVKLLQIGATLFGLLFVSLLVVTMIMPRQLSTQRATPTPSITTTQQQQNDIEAVLQLLHEDIVKADPSLNELPIPPIDFKLNLDGS